MPGLSTTLPALVRRSGLAAIIRRLVARRRVSILLYHDPEPATLDRHLRYLAARYAFISLDDLAAARQGSWSSLPDYPLVVTFDDGWKRNAEFAPLLRRYRCPAAIYVLSAIVGTNRHVWFTDATRPELLQVLPTAERVRALREQGIELEAEHPPDTRQTLTRQEARQMTDTVTFGSHGRLHAALTLCDGAEAEREIELSRAEVEAFAGHPCRHFAYPYGEYSEREFRLLERAGYATARTTDIGWNTADTDPYRLRILGVQDNASLDRLGADLAGMGFFWRWRLTGSWDGRQPQAAERPDGDG